MCEQIPSSVADVQRRASSKRRAKSRGSVAAEQLTVLVLVASCGLGAFLSLGQGMDRATAGDARGGATAQAAGRGGMVVAQQAASEEIIARLAQRVGGLSEQMGRIWDAVGEGMSTGSGDIKNFTLLHGPDGVGKTHLAEAVASVAGGDFEILDARFFKEPRGTLDALYDHVARAITDAETRNDKRLLYLANAEHLGGSVEETRAAIARVNELLGKQSRVGLVASVDDLEHIDAALLDEAGGFGESIALRRPTPEELKEVIKVHLKDPETRIEEGTDVDALAEGLASQANGFLGADVRNFIHASVLEAERRAIRAAMEDGSVDVAASDDLVNAFIAALPAEVTSMQHCPCRGAFQAQTGHGTSVPQYVTAAFLKTVGEYDNGVTIHGQDNASSLYRYTVSEEYRRRWFQGLSKAQQVEYLRAWALQNRQGVNLDFAVTADDLQNGLDEIKGLLDDLDEGNETKTREKVKIRIGTTNNRSRVR